jgi:hypothetical protein
MMIQKMIEKWLNTQTLRVVTKAIATFIRLPFYKNLLKGKIDVKN